MSEYMVEATKITEEYFVDAGRAYEDDEFRQTITAVMARIYEGREGTRGEEAALYLHAIKGIKANNGIVEECVTEFQYGLIDQAKSESAGVYEIQGLSYYDFEIDDPDEYDDGYDGIFIYDPIIWTRMTGTTTGILTTARARPSK